mmetsp:Transcript_12452/g.46508  ORF Transcript_12452/g.46508 Transcript_12452/m.46508 type:complete len:207 (+) Transcript_12452:3047-3667(+)
MTNKSLAGTNTVAFGEFGDCGGIDDGGGVVGNRGGDFNAAYGLPANNSSPPSSVSHAGDTVEVTNVCTGGGGGGTTCTTGGGGTSVTGGTCITGDGAVVGGVLRTGGRCTTGVGAASTRVGVVSASTCVGVGANGTCVGSGTNGTGTGSGANGTGTGTRAGGPTTGGGGADITGTGATETPPNMLDGDCIWNASSEGAGVDSDSTD